MFKLILFTERKTNTAYSKLILLLLWDCQESWTMLTLWMKFILCMNLRDNVTSSQQVRAFVYFSRLCDIPTRSWTDPTFFFLSCRIVCTDPWGNSILAQGGLGFLFVSHRDWLSFPPLSLFYTFHAVWYQMWASIVGAILYGPSNQNWIERYWSESETI